MTPKEKAHELVKRMYKVRSDSVSDITLYFSKQCALIAVDEMIRLYNEMNTLGILKPNSIGFELIEIKQEIEKL